MVSSSVSDLDMDAGLPICLAARYFHVTRATVKGWIARGWADKDGVRHEVAVVGEHWRYGRLYRLRDLIEADRTSRQHPNSSRSDARRKPQPVAAA